MGVRDPPHGPMMPAPGENLEATARSIESDEAGAWLRLLLFGRVGRLKDRRVFKFWVTTRQIFKMGITYGRDAVSPSLLLLQRVFSSIRAGEFKPDETRSGRFANKKPKVAVIEIKDEDVVNLPRLRFHIQKPTANLGVRLAGTSRGTLL